ncbi:uncharacterized protein ACRADG_011132 [Cochliomyia hominivorax]
MLKATQKFACGQFSYELEFPDNRIFSPCEEYPDNAFDSIFDVTNCSIEQNEEGSLVVNGYSTVKMNVDEEIPLTVEVFKKERGSWQPTIYTLRRSNACSSLFGKIEVWYSYLKNTPEEQLTCPLTKGQRIDFDINEPTIVSLPEKNSEGEYKLHCRIGTKDDEQFVCYNIYIIAHAM